MDEEELLLQGDDGAAVITDTDHLDEEQLLNESINGDAGSIAEESAGVVCKIESLDHEELDYEEEEEKEERESRFTSERAKKSPVRAPEDATAEAAKTSENTSVAGRGSYRGRVMRGGAGFRGGMGGNFNMRGGMRMVAGGGSAGPISLLTSNIPPPMMMAGPGIGGPFGKILVNPNFPVGAGLTLLPNPGPGGYGAPPMGLGGPMAPPAALGPKVTLSIDGAPALAVPVSMPRVQPPQMQMGPGPGVPMSMPPPNLAMRPGGQGLMLNPMSAPPPSAMRFPPGMGPPPMNVGMSVPPPGMAPQMAGGAAGNWNLMVEAFLGDKKAAGERSKKKRRRRSRSSSYSSSSGSESSYSESSRSRSRSRSPRRAHKRSSRGSRKHRKERSGRGDSKGERGGERRVFRTGPNSFRINPASSNGSELPSLLDGIERGSSSKDSRSRRADRERQREVRETAVESRLKAFRDAEQADNTLIASPDVNLIVPAPTKPPVETGLPPPSHFNNFPPPSNLSTHPNHPCPGPGPNPIFSPPQRVGLMDSLMPPPHHQPLPMQHSSFNGPPMMHPGNMPMNSFPNFNGPPMGGQPPFMNSRPGSLLNLKFTH